IRSSDSPGPPSLGPNGSAIKELVANNQVISEADELSHQHQQKPASALLGLNTAKGSVLNRPLKLFIV
ncbi:MAG: hypothetical protein VYE16_02915, partial [Cyanobacteriota bacterium]|nr:hypothetical protein [Cyanobacteriota bacterium]